MLVDVEIKPIGEYEGDPFGDPNSDRVWAIRRGQGLYESVMMDQYLNLLGREKGLGYRSWKLNQPYSSRLREYYESRNREVAPTDEERERHMRLLRMSMCEYGVADDVRQIYRKYSIIWRDPRPFVLSYYRISKGPGYQKSYGFRWHKQGEYIGRYKTWGEYFGEDEQAMTVILWSLNEVPEELILR